MLAGNVIDQPKIANKYRLLDGNRDVLAETRHWRNPRVDRVRRLTIVWAGRREASAGEMALGVMEEETSGIARIDLNVGSP